VLPHWLRTHGATRLLALILSLRCRTNSNQFEFVRQIAATKFCRSDNNYHVTRGDLLQQPVASCVSGLIFVSFFAEIFFFLYFSFLHSFALCRSCLLQIWSNSLDLANICAQFERDLWFKLYCYRLLGPRASHGFLSTAMFIRHVHFTRPSRAQPSKLIPSLFLFFLPYLEPALTTINPLPIGHYISS